MNNFIEEINKNLLYYKAACNQLEIWLKSMNSEFDLLEGNNPINHIKTRVKTTESIVGKLKKKNLKITMENVSKLNDVVGARIVVDFIENVYEVLDKIKMNENIKVILEKDYIKKPKESGYRGYHLIVAIPISVSGVTKEIHAEIQIRTTAMDFWATNEHKLNYKVKGRSSSYKEKWIDVAKKVWELDTTINKLYLEERNNFDNTDYKFKILNSIDKLNKVKNLGEYYG